MAVLTVVQMAGQTVQQTADLMALQMVLLKGDEWVDQSADSTALQKADMLVYQTAVQKAVQKAV